MLALILAARQGNDLAVPRPKPGKSRRNNVPEAQAKAGVPTASISSLVSIGKVAWGLVGIIGSIGFVVGLSGSARTDFSDFLLINRQCSFIHLLCPHVS